LRCCWLPQISSARRSPVRQLRFRVSGLWKDAIAWQVTLLMGLQSALAYCVFGWMIPILRDRGLDGASAGAVVSLIGRGTGRFLPASCRTSPCGGVTSASSAWF
jgi:cyanate permease